MAKKGTHLSEEIKKKIRQALLGKRYSMASEFKIGHKPWNTGTKGICKANRTSFKKGNRPANYAGGLKTNGKDELYIRVGNETYKYGKIKVGKYESLARYKYRKLHGEFPKDMVIIHKDGDVLNNQDYNLELISRAELLRRNSYKNINNCIICGKEFPAKVKRCKTCSKECRKEYGKQWSKKYSRERRVQFGIYQKRYKQKLTKNKEAHIHTTPYKYLNSGSMI